MLFKEAAQFRPNSRGIDYLAIDPAYDPVTNKIFDDTRLIDEGGNDFIVGTYTGLLSLTVWDGVMPITYIETDPNLLKEYLTIPITDDLVDVALNDNDASNRKTARDINKKLDSKKTFNAMGQELDDILTDVVSLTSLTNPDKTKIIDALQDT